MARVSLQEKGRVIADILAANGGSMTRGALLEELAAQNARDYLRARSELRNQGFFTYGLRAAEGGGVESVFSLPEQPDEPASNPATVQPSEESE